MDHGYWSWFFSGRKPDKWFGPPRFYFWSSHTIPLHIALLLSKFITREGSENLLGSISRVNKSLSTEEVESVVVLIAFYWTMNWLSALIAQWWPLARGNKFDSWSSHINMIKSFLFLYCNMHRIFDET